MSLRIDRAAAARTPSAEEIRDWAAERSAFISSVMGEMRDERQAVAAAVEALGLRPVLFERFGGRDDDPEAAYLAEVDSADIYLGLIGSQYGRQDRESGFSATHAEYLRARARGKRVSVWAREGATDREGHARNFLEEVRTFQVTGAFRGAEDLAGAVRQRVVAMAAEDLSPWVKLAEAVIRADAIHDDGSTLRVEARIRDPDVAHYVEGLRGDGFHTPTIAVSYGDISRPASVRSVTVETRSASLRRFTIHFEPSRQGAAGGSPRCGVGDLSADEVVAAAVGHALLGQPLPPALQDRFLGAAVAAMPDPWAELEVAGVAEGALPAIARLLLVEALVGTGKAGRLRRFSLGPRVRGQRQVELAWEDAREHAGREPATRQIAGLRSWSSVR